MATRYSGSLKINVIYHDKHGAYRASISRKGKNLWGGWVNPAHASRLAVDSPEAYDAIARSALSFAESDGAGVGDYADVAHGGGPEFWHVRRSEKRPARSNGAKMHTVRSIPGHGMRAAIVPTDDAVVYVTALRRAAGAELGNYIRDVYPVLSSEARALRDKIAAAGEHEAVDIRAEIPRAGSWATNRVHHGKYVRSNGATRRRTTRKPAAKSRRR